eukprot:scaffold9870_cov43-Prasinocladus_malaysianus.AAC.1
MAPPLAPVAQCCSAVTRFQEFASLTAPLTRSLATDAYKSTCENCAIDRLHRRPLNVRCACFKALAAVWRELDTYSYPMYGKTRQFVPTPIPVPI